MNPSQPNDELYKAIERAKECQDLASQIDGQWIYMEHDKFNVLVSAAKRLKEVEKENGLLRARMQSLSAIGEVEQQLSTLRDEYKKALEAIESIKPEKDCPFCSKADEPCYECYTMARLQGRLMHVRSTPLAIEIMKGEA